MKNGQKKSPLKTSNELVTKSADSNFPKRPKIEIQSITSRHEAQKLERTENFYYSNYCRTCDLKFNLPSELFNHRFNQKHLNLLKICRNVKFVVRLPPNLNNLKKSDLKICDDFKNNQCKYQNRDTYENYCPMPHNDYEINQWSSFFNISNQFKDKMNQVEEVFSLEDIFLVKDSVKLKKMVGSYSNETYGNEKIDDLFKTLYVIRECNYETLWHKFINKEMISCINLVEKYEWDCSILSREIDMGSTYYSMKLSMKKPDYMTNLNDLRLAQYISLVKVKCGQNEFKLEIARKIFSETLNSYEIDLTVRGEIQFENDTMMKGVLLIDKSMFNMMHFAIDHVNKFFLFPKLANYNIEIQEDLDIADDEKKIPKEFNSKQKKIIKRILNVKTAELTPPVTIVYLN